MRRVAVACVVAVCLPACLPDSGDRYAGLAVHDDEAGRFRVRYASPPWEEPDTLSGSLGDAFALEIASPYESLAIRRKVYRFGVSVLAEAAEPVALRTQAEVVGAGFMLLSGVEEVESDSGDSGFDLTWVRSDVMEGRYGRARVYSATFGSVIVRLEANPDPRNQDIGRMLGAIDVEPERHDADGGP